MKKLGLYVHIPFCLQKCVYCDFLSSANGDAALYEDYVRALLSETAAKGTAYADYTVDTVFIGGGTPSVLEGGQILRVMDGIRAHFSVDGEAEITIEANPGTLTEQKLGDYRRAGINRLSMGVQSFDDGLLGFIGRIHTADEARESFALARRAGFDNINLDLMFSIPGHTYEKWTATLVTAVALRPEHISFYSLQLEEGTPLFTAFERGEFMPASDADDRRMYRDGLTALQAAGYVQYEISNAALPGRESRHNLKYWSLDEYLSLGIGGHSFVNGTRFSNTTDIAAYIADEGKTEHATFHVNSVRDNAGEFVFTGLRKTEGISLTEFATRIGTPFDEFYRAEEREIREYIAGGFLELRDDRLRLTETGTDISNAVMSVFV